RGCAMRDWRDVVRSEFGGRQQPSEQAIEELAQHVEETWRAARASGRSEAEALELAIAQLRNGPARLPANMAAPPRRGPAAVAAAAWRDLKYAIRMLRGRPGF